MFTSKARGQWRPKRSAGALRTEDVAAAPDVAELVDGIELAVLVARVVDERERV